ncbi:dihydroorotate dehydrogenase [Bacillus coahuilensis p1.1.43]|uniref:Dihydroorotate dehydrogenase n=2 Tax=Bacillus coahuilensis TaxID=408580 RepID=A0A147K849_9BACI|nr:hypothetical protein [Bacillus coahuilensis]KUP06280.1 dihydroorotate dehydrogenase [Bacillus coahuilensis p1.1.43]
MPDWSYHIMFHPFLKKLPPYQTREFIHKGMTSISNLPKGEKIIHFLGREESSPQLIKTIDDNLLVNSIGLSGKIDPLLTGTKAFSNLGFSFIEVGPVTIQPKRGTPPSRNPNTQQVEFSSDLELIGLQATKRKLKKLSISQAIFIRLAGTTSEIRMLIQELNSVASGFIVDVFDEDYAQFTHNPIYVSTALNDLHIQASGMSKSIKGYVVELGEENVNSLTLKKLRDFTSKCPAKTLLTSGGISEPIHGVQLLKSGVDLIMLQGGYVTSGPGLTKRINEALLNLDVQQPEETPGWKSFWIFGLLIFLGGLLALLFSITTILLPYDETFLRMQREEIWAFNERIMLFMTHDRITLAGTMISGGILYMTLSYFGVKNGLKWAKDAINAAAIIGFLGIFAFIGFGYFDWLHLVFWMILLPFYIDGYRKTRYINETPTSSNLFNDSVWRKGVLGQFFFVMLGFSFVIGGVVISTFGVTSVFVPTDLLYICMTPDQLQLFNNRLIPVIAHDRAGFGSALLSVGILVLTLSLWGFQQGKKWVWWTLFLGGLPAFISGISIHFIIGYISFIHLLPAYVALGLYCLGLYFSYHFFSKSSVK